MRTIMEWAVLVALYVAMVGSVMTLAATYSIPKEMEHRSAKTQEAFSMHRSLFPTSHEPARN